MLAADKCFSDFKKKDFFMIYLGVLSVAVIRDKRVANVSVRLLFILIG